MEYREYQREAIDEMLADFDNDNNSIVCLPQAAGKSHVIADVALFLNKKVLVLTPTRELVKQDVEKLIIGGGQDIGVCAGSLGRYDSVNKVVVGIINTVKNYPARFRGLDCIIIDECDLVKEEEDGMYREFFDKLPGVKIFGLTATPYRNVQERYWDNDGNMVVNTRLSVLTRGGFWDDIIYCQNIKDLTPQYLVPIEYIREPVIYKHELRENTSGTEYTEASIDLAFKDVNRMKIAADKIKKAEKVYKSILVFAPNISSSNFLSSLIPDSEVVVGKTPSKKRTELIDNFKAGKIQTLISVDVLTAGFNYDELECVVLLRPTKSIRKYQQMVGRVMRKGKVWTGELLSPYREKTKGVLLDLCNTSLYLGPIDSYTMEFDGDSWELYSQFGPMHGELLGSFTKRR